MGGATKSVKKKRIHPPNFNPRSPWGERRPATVAIDRAANFNPRSPWGERLSGAQAPPHLERFQSTLPVGGATERHVSERRQCQISIHAPRGGSDRFCQSSARRYVHFNPRSPWGERQASRWGLPPQGGFQSTLPVGGATLRLATKLQTYYISIHAPRGGSDALWYVCANRLHYFNPRSPWGERR